MNAPDHWQTDGGTWWTDAGTLGQPIGDGKAALDAARKAGILPWLAGGLFGFDPGPSGVDEEWLHKHFWRHAAGIAAALTAEYALHSVRPQLFPLKFVSADVNRRVQVVARHCVTNTLVFAAETGKENKGLVRAVQAVKDDFPFARQWFIPWRRGDGRVVHYDMTAPGLELVIRERLENQPGIGFDKDEWIKTYAASHREAEAGRVLWFVQYKLKLPVAVDAGPNARLHIDTRGKPDAIPPAFQERLVEYGPEIADLCRRNGMVLYPQPMRQLILDFNKHHHWDDVIRDAWGHR